LHASVCAGSGKKDLYGSFPDQLKVVKSTKPDFFLSSIILYKSLFTVQYGRNVNEKTNKQKTFTANYYTL